MFMFHFKKYVNTREMTIKGEKTKTDGYCSMFCNFALPEGDFKIEISKLKNVEVNQINVFTSAKVALK